jgi:leucine dehydrogenase
MWRYDDSRAAVRDALRLSRAMTYKSAVAALPLGGGKGVIMLGEPLDGWGPRLREDALRDFGDAVGLLDGVYVTAEDVGTSAADMEVIAEQTPHVSGLSRERGGSGDPSPFTALGVTTAIAVSCERVFGTSALEGRSVAVVGLGHVGARIAELLAEAGARLVVADIDVRKRAIADRIGATWTTPEEALVAPVDVYAPCALGGILDDETVAALQCPVVAGAANNQLADDHVADALAAHGVLWAPDFVANAGGIINISVELGPGGYDAALATERVRGVGDTLRQVFDDADHARTTPLAAAMELARRRLAEAGRPRPALAAEPPPPPERL